MLRIVSTHAGSLHVQEDAPLDRLPEGALWLDLHQSPAAEEAAVERLIGLDIPTRAEAAAIGESARLYTEGGALIMTAAVVAGVSEGRRPIAADVTFLLTARLLVTVRDADPLPFRAFAQKCAREPDVRERPETIFLALVESIIDRAAEILRDAQSDLERISAEVFADAEREAPPAKGRRKRRQIDLRVVVKRLGRINALAARLRESLLGLGRMLAFFRQNAGARLPEAGERRLSSLETDVRALNDYDAQLAAELEFVLEAVFGLTNAEQNRVIRVFTIASVLFLPPTMVGTIYGMNFRGMPELEWTFGYPLALALMVASALVPYWLFRRNSWL